MEVSVFYSERKVQEVERKWAASLGPKHAALLMSGKIDTVPLLESSTGYPHELSPLGEPEGVKTGGGVLELLGSSGRLQSPA